MGRVDDSLNFSAIDSREGPPWKIMIVDDEPEVHDVTRLVLGGFQFADRRLQFLSAHSAAEARAVLIEHPDIAVVTAVDAEHMEFFKTIDAVAKVELVVASFSSLTIINRDDVNEDYAQYASTSSIDTYGLGGVAEYRFIIQDATSGKGFKCLFVSPVLG